MFRYAPLKERFDVSPDEQAFTRFRARAALARAGFADVDVAPFDFLHPGTPAAWIDGVAALGRALEKIALVREIAGSPLMRARRP